MPISKATLQDVPALVELVNSAYRGDTSRKGWTTEADLLVGGRRVDEKGMTEMIMRPAGRVLKYEDEQGHIVGCVYLEEHPDHFYLGTLTVAPMRQAGGIGKQLLQAADTLAQQLGKAYIMMTVITLRKELIAWYNRHGYRDTGVRRPFPHEPWQGRASQPLEFMILRKEIIVKT